MEFTFTIEQNKAYLVDNQKNYFDTDLTKFFDGDILDSDKNLIKSNIRNRILVGTFSTSQTQRFGKNKKGNVIFLVKPLNLKLPGFTISYGGKLKGKIAIRFKFTEWNNKLPSGEIVDVIGNFNSENKINILMFHHNIYPKKLKIEGNNLEQENTRTRLPNLDIFSVDPDNCQDIDDALSIEVTDKKTIIGVHIAQPSSFLSLQDIKNKMKHQFSTLYINDTRKDLWGEEITYKSSLFENQLKPAYSTFFHFDNNNLIGVTDYPSIISNKKKLSYQNANTYSSAKRLYNFTKQLEDIEDYHELISYWMIKTNNYIGQKLKNKIPYRVNNEKENINFLKITLPEDIGKKLKSKKIEGAYYSNKEIRHETLGLDYYCHFTSPIRRIIDTWIHYMLTYGKIDSSDLDIDKINYFDQETKKFHRQIELDSIIDKLFEKENHVTTEGYITEIISNNSIEVYLEEIGFTKIRLYNRVFDYLVEKKLDSSLFLKYNDQSYEYKVGNKIEICLDKIDEILPKDRILITHKDALFFI